LPWDWEATLRGVREAREGCGFCVTLVVFSVRLSSTGVRGKLLDVPKSAREVFVKRMEGEGENPGKWGEVSGD